MSDFTVPELGENVAGGDVAKVLVKVGDTVRREQSVIELETDKATVEVPSSVEGVRPQWALKASFQVSVNSDTRRLAGTSFSGMISSPA